MFLKALFFCPIVNKLKAPSKRGLYFFLGSLFGPHFERH